MLPNWLYGKSKSKLAELLGGGGMPSDYNEVKTQVNQNAEDIALLNNTVEGKVGWNDYSELGAVNLLLNNAVSKTQNSIVFTVNSKTKAINVNGTNDSAHFVYDISAIEDNYTLKKGRYRLSGCPSDGNLEDLRLQIYTANNPTLIAIDTGEGAVFTLSEDTQLRVTIRVGLGVNVSNKTFYPMIAPASYNGPYVPPAKTNKELTDELTIGAVSATANTDYLNGTNNAIFRKYGK